MKLYELTKEAQSLEELYLMAIDEETGEIKDATILEELERQLNSQLIEKSAGIIKVLRNSESMVEALKAEEDRLKRIRKSMENKEENFKKYIINNMLRMNVKKIETELGTISLRNSDAVEIYDETLIDEQYINTKIEKKADKTAIKKAIKDGIEIQGVRLITNVSLSVR